HGDHGAPRGRIHVRGGLDRLDDAEGGARPEDGPDLGKLHVGYVAERPLRVVGYPHRGRAVGGGPEPLVGLCVAEVRGDVAHGVFFSSTNGGLTSRKSIALPLT